MTEKVRALVQASEMRYLLKIKGVPMFEEVREIAIHKCFIIKLLLLQIERSQLR